MLNILKKRTQKRSPRLLVVDRCHYISPNMIRVTFAGKVLEGIPFNSAGANCKIMLPDENQSLEEFKIQLMDGPKPVTRTYTVRQIRSDPLEMDIDFVAHGENGPASKWVMNANPGDFIGFAGPSSPKIQNFYADWYLIAADMSALPVAAATLEAMPEDAKGVAIFEILSEADKQKFSIPSGIDVNWVVSPDPYSSSTKQLEFLKQMQWPSGIVQTCVAGESAVIRTLRNYLNNDKNIDRRHTYISGYWKIGLVEDEHQAYKRAQSDA
ncbi:MAG: siderophore-interacting protein [Pseudomonadota bacterium]